jgi:Domain of unknown function (DUF1707)
MSTPEDRRPLRIGNDEREAAYLALDAHLNAGRLDADEYGERYAQASVARTRDQLDALFVDLPAPHPPAAPSPDGGTRATGSAGMPSWDLPPDEGRPSWMPQPAAALMAVVPFIALALFFLTDEWLFLLLIPAAATFMGGRHRHSRG